MAETTWACIPFTDSLHLKTQVSAPVRIFQVMDATTASGTAWRLLLVAVVGLLALPAAHAAEPTAPKNASQWCKAWKAGNQTAKLAELYPGSTTFAATFTTKTGKGLDKTNLFGRCVSLTAKKLVAAKRTADAGGPAGATLKSRCAAELAAAAPAYRNLGRCIADRGRQLTP
jgi:hypothetical protein